MKIVAITLTDPHALCCHEQAFGALFQAPTVAATTVAIFPKKKIMLAKKKPRDRLIASELPEGLCYPSILPFLLMYSSALSPSVCFSKSNLMFRYSSLRMSKW
jgi:hypothetical protein